MRPFQRTVALAATTLLAVGLAACGSTSLDEPAASSGQASSSASAVPHAVLDEALAGQVPAELKSAGKLVDGSDGSYAPNEFIDTDGTTMIGMDVDLLNAVATTLGLTVDYNNAKFDSILLGVTSGKYDVAISSFTVNPEREKQVTMIRYFNAGTQWAVPQGNPKKVDVANTCGLAVSVQKGTVQVDDLEARSKKCVQAGKPAIKAIVEDEQSKATADVVSGKADAMLADSPIVSYAVQQTKGQLEKLGDVYEAAPYGIVVPKDDKQLADAIAGALVKLKKDGVYDAILATWGNEEGAVDAFPHNG